MIKGCTCHEPAAIAFDSEYAAKVAQGHLRCLLCTVVVARVMPSVVVRSVFCGVVFVVTRGSGANRQYWLAWRSPIHLDLEFELVHLLKN